MQGLSVRHEDVEEFLSDTNVFLARYASGEKEHESSKRLVQATEEGRLKAVTSTLTLVEIASSVRRTPGKFDGKTSSDVAGSFVRRALSLRNLEYVPLGAEMSLDGRAGGTKVPLMFSAALKAVKTLPLRTLDLLHIASAYVAMRILRDDLSYFATLDEGILGQGKPIREFLSCPAVRPSELVRLEGL